MKNALQTLSGVKISENLQYLYQNADQKVQELISGLFSDYFKLYKELKAKHGALKTVKAFNDEIDNTISEKINQNEISCKKECCFCCYIPVKITEDEATSIIEYCKNNNIEIDYELAEKQKDKDLFSLPYPDRKCIFLKNTLCSIYPVRPAVCKCHYVNNPPEQCNSELYLNGTVSRIGISLIEIYKSVIFSGSKNAMMADCILELVNTKTAIV